MISRKSITLIEAKTIPEAIRKLQRFIVHKAGKSIIHDLILLIEEPEYRPLTIKGQEALEINAIKAFFKLATSHSKYRQTLSRAITKIKKRKSAMLPLSINGRKMHGLMIIKANSEKREIRSTIVIREFESIEKLNLILALAQLITEDLSLSSGMEAGRQLVLIPFL